MGHPLGHQRVVLLEDVLPSVVYGLSQSFLKNISLLPLSQPVFGLRSLQLSPKLVALFRCHLLLEHLSYIFFLPDLQILFHFENEPIVVNFRPSYNPVHFVLEVLSLAHIHVNGNVTGGDGSDHGV